MIVASHKLWNGMEESTRRRKRKAGHVTVFAAGLMTKVKRQHLCLNGACFNHHNFPSAPMPKR